MGLRTEFALHHSGLEAFLFAPLWQEENGSVLSVLSALARLGMDPWKEAAILAGKPKKDAADALAATLARLPRGPGEPSSRSKLAEHAVTLLPGEAAAAHENGNRNTTSAKYMDLIIVVAATLAILLTVQWFL